MFDGSLPRPAVPPILLLAVLAGALASPPGAVAGERGEMEVVFEQDGDPIYRVLPPGRIPAIETPRFVRGSKAEEQMAPREPVFGLVFGAEARAYSLWQLDRHEIVNDRIGETALAVTW